MVLIEDYFKKLWYIPDRRAIPPISLGNGVFPAFLEVDISSNRFELPTPLVPYAESAKIQGCNKLAFNLVSGADYIGRRTFHKKTINTILRQFIEASLSSMRMAHVITSKGLHYYGCRGMIFNENYQPLILSTVEAEYNPESNKLELSHPKFRISYKVFEGSSEIVEKTIIKQAIPCYANNKVCIKYGGVLSDATPVEVIIEHSDSWIVKPRVPTPNSFSTEYLNGLIDLHETL